MKMIRGMKDNLSFNTNENVERAEAVLRSSINMTKYLFLVRGMPSYTIGYDEDTGDVLCFFPIFTIVNVLGVLAEKQIFPYIIREWKKANFEIVEQKEIPPLEYYHAPYESLLFRLKSLI